MAKIKDRLTRLEAKTPAPEKAIQICRVIVERGENGELREVGRMYRQSDGSLGPMIPTPRNGEKTERDKTL
ncbi:hypothetical protein [Acidocella aromatica]|uniref:Uncharacterized protein n=1 Tax=Acidocella aromatica TaxID=1303579 RepID=A0A840VER7_9PROT|nr:hypothetical protein [Acidocella aromatica]MBB5374328.1 hypothetical protein [Acidocella aromatica]